MWWQTWQVTSNLSSQKTTSLILERGVRLRYSPLSILWAFTHTICIAFTRDLRNLHCNSLTYLFNYSIERLVLFLQGESVRNLQTNFVQIVQYPFCPSLSTSKYWAKTNNDKGNFNAENTYLYILPNQSMRGARSGDFFFLRVQQPRHAGRLLEGVVPPSCNGMRWVITSNGFSWQYAHFHWWASTMTSHSTSVRVASAWRDRARAMCALTLSSSRAMIR